MSVAASDIILHNYPQSPVAEKIRVSLGIKNLAWYSVEIPRLPPKPLLTPLTGGYRRTPVMQIGADVYCDSQCIVRELERRHPSPTFMPTSNAGLMWSLSRLTDGTLFDLAVKIVLGSAGDGLAKDFAEDRGRLYLGENWSEGLKQANAQLPHLVSQLRAPLSWLNNDLGDGRKFLLGDSPAAIDAQFYHIVWFVRDRWKGGPSMLSQFEHLVRWEDAVRALGHGSVTELTAEDALRVARSATPLADSGVIDSDPQGLRTGMNVSVAPDVESGEQFVQGILRYADAHTLVVEHTASEVGTVCVHFPRTGYRIDVTD